MAGDHALVKGILLLRRSVDGWGKITPGMRAIAPRASQRGLVGRGIVLLLGVAVALGVLHTALPLHLHHGATAGAYNEEHVLAALDSTAGDAPLPAEPPGAGIDLAPTEAPRFTDAPPAAPALRTTRSRAPPLA